MAGGLSGACGGGAGGGGAGFAAGFAAGAAAVCGGSFAACGGGLNGGGSGFSAGGCCTLATPGVFSRCSVSSGRDTLRACRRAARTSSADGCAAGGANAATRIRRNRNGGQPGPPHTEDQCMTGLASPANPASWPAGAEKHEFARMYMKRRQRRTKRLIRSRFLPQLCQTIWTPSPMSCNLRKLKHQQ